MTFAAVQRTLSTVGVACLGLLLGIGSHCGALAEPLDDSPRFATARQALEDGFPGVAGLKARRLLELRSWNPAERRRIAALAVESFLQARDGRSAWSLLQREDVPGKDVLSAQARALLGDFAQAEKLLERQTGRGGSAEAQLLLAQTHVAAGNVEEAREALVALLQTMEEPIALRARLLLAEIELEARQFAAALRLTSSPEGESPQSAGHLQRLLRAKALIGLGRCGEAQSLLRDILGHPGGGESVHHCAAVALADCHIRQGRHDLAVESLLQVLDQWRESQFWSPAFGALEAALFEATPPATVVPGAVLRWIAEGNAGHQALSTEEAARQPSVAAFRGYALLLAAKWLHRHQRFSEALGLLEAFLHLHPRHPQVAEAMRLALEIYGALGVDARVETLADQWRQRFGQDGSPLIASVTGATAYGRRDFNRAAALFQSAAQLAGSLSERRGALYNAGVAALRAGEIALYQRVLGQLESAGPEGQMPEADAASLSFARALDAAAKSQPDAETLLRDFTARFPQDPRVPEARIALAEALVLSARPDLQAVEQALAAAESDAPISPELRQRAAYARLWLHDKLGNLEQAAAVGTDFLKSWPESPRAAEIRMKMADAHFRLGNFAKAGAEFEGVAKEYPESPFADTALYFAGLSALSLIGPEGRETAISIWRDLAERGGPLSVPARQQQAMAKLLDDKPAEALKLLDDLLSEKNLSADLRRSLVCEKAEILITLAKTLPSRLQEAIQLLASLTAEPDLPYRWRARAGHTLAWALKEAGKPEEALEACYDVVRAPDSAVPTNPAEYRWYYRSGFFGIDLLKDAKRWEDAARLAEILAQSKGERATEARELATAIRLEHFLWDGRTK